MPTPPPPTVRHRIIAALRARLDASTAWRRPEPGTRTLVALSDSGGARSEYDTQTLSLNFIVGQIEEAPPLTGDDEADQAALDARINEMMGEIIAAMGSDDIGDDTDERLCEAPYIVEAGPIEPPDGSSRVGVAVQFATTYTHLIGDPYTAA